MKQFAILQEKNSKNDYRETGNTVLFEVEDTGGWLSVAIQDATDHRAAEVAIEIVDGIVWAYVWNFNDMGNDPSAKLMLATLDQLGKGEEDDQ